MTARAKFLFDLDFAAPTGVKQANTISLAAHETALAEAEARGYANGLVAAEAQERTRAERQTAAAYERIGAVLSRLANELPAIAGRMEAEAVGVAVAVARKLAPALIAKEPFAEIAALAGAALRELTAAPHVVIRVNEALYPLAHERLAAMARACGFEARLVVLGETEIAPGDCRIEWADGGLIRDRAAVEAAVAQAVERYIAGRRGDNAERGEGSGHV
jgi:flagellar assembly protein FliH